MLLKAIEKFGVKYLQKGRDCSFGFVRLLGWVKKVEIVQAVTVWNINARLSFSDSVGLI